MTTTTDTPATIWLPGDDTDGLDAVAIPLDTKDLHLSVAVPTGQDRPDVGVREDDGVVSLTLTTPGPARVTAVLPTHDAVALWRPGSGEDHSRIPASWEDAGTASPLSGMAIGSLVGADDTALVTYGADAGENPVRVRAGLVEETAELLVSFEVEPARSVPFRVEIDVSGATFAGSVEAMTDRLTGPRTRPAPADERPVLCTWYFLHQAIDGGELTRHAAPAAALGFGSLIVDDGWQTAETARGYGSAGDWAVEPSKLADAAGVVEAFASHGIRTMWWIGTPFIGHRSEAHGRVATVADEPALEASVLDPRSSNARQHLVERITDLIARTGAHGVKIDFLERFAGRTLDADVEPAALRMLDELDASLRAVRPDVSIEYREPYSGPAATELATMIRVGDCPMSPARNRTGIVDLRLATNGIAVHADPVMWAADDSAERVAQHLQNTLFGVPQVSVDVTALSNDHERALRFWLAFADEHRDLLLHGSFRPSRPDLHYPVVVAESGDEVVSARYQPVALDAPDGTWHRWFVVNADAPVVDLHGAGPEHVRVMVFDACGTRVAERDGTLPDRLIVPTGGLAVIERG